MYCTQQETEISAIIVSTRCSERIENTYGYGARYVLGAGMESPPSRHSDFRDLQAEKKSPQAASDAPEEPSASAVGGCFRSTARISGYSDHGISSRSRSF